MEIILYSTHCPKCMVLENLMKKKNMEFTLIDNEEEVLKIADENNIIGVPFAEVDGKILNTKELQNFINNMEGK